MPVTLPIEIYEAFEKAIGKEEAKEKSSGGRLIISGRRLKLKLIKLGMNSPQRSF
jgi:hypothetical protein